MERRRLHEYGRSRAVAGTRKVGVVESKAVCGGDRGGTHTVGLGVGLCVSR